MSIDWSSLLLVASVTLVATSLILLLAATAVRLLVAAERQREAGGPAGRTPGETAAYALLAVLACVLVTGLWLIIPYFH